MNFLYRVNKTRIKVRNRLTKKIGRSPGEGTAIITEEVKRILICRPNHRLGNLILVTPLVQEVSEVFPNAKIDLFVKGGLAPIIFKNYEEVDNIIQLPKKHFNDWTKYLLGWLNLKKKPYDLVINLEKGSLSGKLSTQFARSQFKFFGEDIEAEYLKKYTDYQHKGKKPVYDFRNSLTKIGVPNSPKEIPILDLKLDKTEVAQGKKLLEDLVSKERKTICLFTYATGDKCYSEEWWLDFHKELKKKFGHYNILEILPVENISNLGFKEPSFYSKDIREIGSVIANTSVFIGADSGIMHLASAVKTPTIGLFSGVFPEKYEPYGNNSIAVRTVHTSADEILSITADILQEID